MSRLSTVGELTRLMMRSGRWWMVPMLGVLALTALLLVGVAAVEYVAPFVYTIF
jgi:TRAP-type C4-dicarboxylate transport system permease small subunit